MLVKHLIRELQKCDPEAEVGLCDYGDGFTHSVHRGYDGSVEIHGDARHGYNNTDDTPDPLPAGDQPLTGWHDITLAPNDRSILLFANRLTPIYVGRYRRGCGGEPQPNELAWRCDCSGRFATPVLWAYIPGLDAHGTPER